MKDVNFNMKRVKKRGFLCKGCYGFIIFQLR
jgi:hypothetical protein